MCDMFLPALRRAWPLILGLLLLISPAVSGASAAAPTPPPSQAVVDPTGSNPTGPVVEAPGPQSVQQQLDHLKYAINFAWVLVCAFLVMFMQVGFALLETGLVRAKNAAHTMSMNFLVYVLSVVAFWAVGFAIMCGGANGVPGGASAPLIGGPSGLGGVPTLNHMFFIHIAGKPFGLFGLRGFFLAEHGYDAAVAIWFLYMLVFMDTAATIPTGALAERWSFKSFFIFSLFIGSVIYPFYGCWMWGGGWLAALGHNFGLGHGAVDFAGSSVVHMQGGVIALVCAWMLGPRLGKYDVDGRPQPILGHHIPMVITGTLILAFGWFGFNAGSSMAGTDLRVGIIAVNTMLASAAGALASAVLLWTVYGKPDPSMMCNGMLAGLVAITAGCAFVQPWAAILIGAFAGVISDLSVFFFERRGIDDPVGAISVHFIGGLWGIIAVGLFADGSYGMGWQGVSGHVTGLFYGDAKQLVAQLIAGGTCFVWNFCVAGGIFWAIGRFLRTNRVPPEVEVAGLDIPELGAPGYPEFITPIAPEMVSRSQIESMGRPFG